MNSYYPNLLSPLRVGNGILKNRMICPPSDPHYIQGHQNYPTEETIYHYASRARGGAAIVTVEGCGLHQFPEEDHHWGWDATCGCTQNMMSQLADAVHFYGSKIHGTLMMFTPPQFDVSPDSERVVISGDLAPEHKELPKQEIPKKILLDMIEQYAQLAKFDQECGFDGIYVHMSYRLVLPGRMLSPRTNHRSDEFGGSLENRIRFPLMLCKRIKELCGSDFMIEASISGEEKDGWSIDDSIYFAKAAKGLVDLLQIRCGDLDPNHPTGYCLEKTPWLSMCAAIKKGAPEMKVVAVAGFFAPEDGERALAEGKADLIAMARAFISNPDYGNLVAEGRADELVPCIRCNKCHRSGPNDPWLSVCSVNSEWAAEARMKKLVLPAERKKRVAILGGGIAGMEAAEICDARGHDVSIYEKSDSLGGLLKHAAYADFKWPIRDYLNYHVRRVTENGSIKIYLNTVLSPQELNSMNYDVVIAAVGSIQPRAKIPISDGADVWTAVDVYGHEQSLGQKVIVVGAGEVGMETGLYLARRGHSVMVLGRGTIPARQAFRVHFYDMFLEACKNEKNLRWELPASCTNIKENGVWYINGGGETVFLEADSVVLASGMRANIDSAMEYSCCGQRFYTIGDCVKAGSIQSAVRSAYTIANSI